MLKLYDDLEEDNITACIDESGRGPLIGPVFASAVILNNAHDPDDTEIHKIKDSKKLSASMREYLSEYIKSIALDYSVVSVDNHVIDEINILNANYRAMHSCLDNLNIDFDQILIDGNSFKPYKKKSMTIPFRTVVGGDNIYVGIAAASILAKVEHDAFIKNICDEYPELEKYGLRTNMGYGTSKHIEAIRTYGYSDFHRKSFKLKNI